ncbi:putative mitochondrial group I intron splicing factor CCM1 [[Candida] railenensis]|uniref:Mitochondrial group I intron splicing factor CCM1 n=1 Tax=[Candida] railenensis TaxID=45579 RepID=A0A9P0VXW9_9ASCO|nr:putative mitochondrial group I intron splicing factor CCM1 [[Candida] railenensis]
MIRRGIVAGAYRHEVLSGQRLFIRSKSKWFNPLSRFSNKSNKQEHSPQSNQQVSNKSHMVTIEEPDNSYTSGSGKEANHASLVRDFNHYLRTDIPDILQQKILTDKLSQYIRVVPDFGSDKTTIPILNKVFLRLYTLQNNEIEGTLSLDELLILFEKSTLAVTNESRSNSENFYVPKYLALLARHFYTQPNDDGKIPVKIFVYVVELGSSIIKNSSLKDSLQLLFNNKNLKLSADFTSSLIKYLTFKKRLSIVTFQEIFQSSVNSGRFLELIDDEFFDTFNGYVENLYRDTPPLVHEYKNLERNLETVQQVTNQIIETLLKEGEIGVDFIGVSSYLKMAKLSHELDSVSMNTGFPNGSTKTLEFLVENSENLELLYEEIRREIFKQNLDEESLAEVLLITSWGSTKLNCLANMLSEYIASDEVKFSFEIRLQAKLGILLSGADGSESEIFEFVEKSISEMIAKEEDSAKNKAENLLDFRSIHAKVIQVALTSPKIPARGYFTQSLLNFFKEKYHATDFSVYSFKYQVDKAVSIGNHLQAVNAFEDSLDQYTQWPTSRDPMTKSTLDNLVVLICKEMDNIEDIFPIFTKIKQQMVDSQCSIDSINAMAGKMLQAEFVGDTIEFLKRELPKIGKEDTEKLPMTEKYGNLFSTLHNFVLTYKNESTFETNWVLYGEIHRYFNVPYEYYLPAMKFFSENQRQNASLIIFRQMVRLNELHGHGKSTPFLAPSRDHYLLLFQEFGNQLYEDGVAELHEYIKMDVHIPKQDIQLQNTILNAYSNLQDVPKTKDLFLAMSSNPKEIGGINEDSIQIMIKTYTYSDIAYVKKFWNNLSQYGIIPNYGIFKQYLIAHVYHGLTEEAIELTQGEMSDYEIEMSSDILISMFNFSLESSQQQKISTWAQEQYPSEWETAKSSGSLKATSKSTEDPSLMIEKGYETEK